MMRTKVTFDITSSIQNEYGMAVPAYFAYDDVTVKTLFPYE